MRPNKDNAGSPSKTVSHLLCQSSGVSLHGHSDALCVYVAETRKSSPRSQERVEDFPGKMWGLPFSRTDVHTHVCRCGLHIIAYNLSEQPT